jgi:hypothetical protein
MDNYIIQIEQIENSNKRMIIDAVHKKTYDKTYDKKQVYAEIMSEFKSGDKKILKRSLDFYLNIDPKDYNFDSLEEMTFIENGKLNKSLIKKIMLKEKYTDITYNDFLKIIFVDKLEEKDKSISEKELSTENKYTIILLNYNSKKRKETPISTIPIYNDDSIEYLKYKICLLQKFFWN